MWISLERRLVAALGEQVWGEHNSEVPWFRELSPPIDGILRTLSPIRGSR
jgi:hypothetical protein